MRRGTERSAGEQAEGHELEERVGEPGWLSAVGVAHYALSFALTAVTM